MKNGYFKDQVEGSKLYLELMERAKNDFKNSFIENDGSSHGSIILTILKDAHIDVDKMREESERLPAPDDDKWLEISPEDLDGMLAHYSTTNGTFSKGAQAEEEFDLNQVTNSMKSFVDKVSSHEGAEFPWTAENQDVQFNAESFAETVKKLLEGSNTTLPENADDIDDIMDLSDDDVLGEAGESSDGEDESEEEEMKSYMSQMDQELSHTTLGKSFEKESKLAEAVTSQEKSRNASSKLASDEANEDQDDSSPVDVDLNLVKNILESFSLQQGLAGPATNILSAMGVNLPQDSQSGEA